MVLELATGFLVWLSGTIQWLTATFGLPGLFAAAIIENATLFIGIPFEVILVTFYFASGTHPILISVTAGLGAAIGELTSYAVGRAGTHVAERIEEKKMKENKAGEPRKGKGLSEKDKRLLGRLEQWVNRKGSIAVYFLAVMPIPFDLVGLACGITKMHPVKFFVPAFLGKTTRFLIVMAAAGLGLRALLAFFGVSL